MSDGELPKIQPTVEVFQRVQPSGPQRDRQRKKRPPHEPTEDVIEVGGEEPEAAPETPPSDETEEGDGLDLRV